MEEKTKGKMRYCFHCGTDVGVTAYDYDKLYTCGKLECERAAREEMRQEREEAHRKLDEDMGYI